MSVTAPGPVASLEHLNASRRLVCEVDGVSVVLLKTGGSVAAFRNACTHLGLPLDQGRLIAGQIHCPYHGAAFDLATGRAISGPAVAPLQRYAVRVEGDAIYVTPQPPA